MLSDGISLELDENFDVSDGARGDGVDRWLTCLACNNALAARSSKLSDAFTSELARRFDVSDGAGEDGGLGRWFNLRPMTVLSRNVDELDEQSPRWAPCCSSCRVSL